MTLEQKQKSKSWVDATCLGCGGSKLIRTYKLTLFKNRGRGYRCFTCAKRGDGVDRSTPLARHKVLEKCEFCGAYRKILQSGISVRASLNKKSKCLSCSSRIIKGVSLSDPKSGDRISTKCTGCGVERTLNWRSIKRKVKEEKPSLCISCACKKGVFKSKAEFELIDFLVQGCGIPKKSIVHGDRKILKKKELDVFVPSKNFAIEYNGNIWHSEKFKKDRLAHFQKRKQCEELGIRLVQVREDEWIYKEDIVKSMLKHLLGISDKVYYARKLKIKIVPNKLAQIFLEANHLMGGYRSSRSVGLFTEEDILVQLFSYKLLKDKTVLDCTRICGLTNTSVVGGVSRLLKYTLRQNSSVLSVHSFVDLRYGNGSSLLKLGFSHTGTTLGFSWTNGRKVYNRLQCRANMDERKLTQAQHAEELKWYKLWDAGQAKFVLYT